MHVYDSLENRSGCGGTLLLMRRIKRANSVRNITLPFGMQRQFYEVQSGLKNA